MSDDEKLYETLWSSSVVDYHNITNNIKLPTPPKDGLLRTITSENEDTLSQSYVSFEGESVDDLDISVFKSIPSDSVKKIMYSRPTKPVTVPFPKKPCFSELDDNDKLEYHGPIIHIVQKLTTNKKSRYAVLISNRLILFEKPEHKVSKIQIPLSSMTKIEWIESVNYTNKNDCNKFKLDTPVRSYKFQCSSHENAGVWINHIGKLIYDKQNVDDTKQPAILKATVSLENVKGKRIFAVESKYTVAYYESEEDYKYGIAMHRIQLRSSGLKRIDANSFSLITSYREYKLTFETNMICDEWFKTLTVIIQNAISSTICSKNAKSGDEILAALCQNASNRFCAECKSSDIQWASINLFITLCAKCAGVHRGLGPNVSKIQGIFTDEVIWEDDDLMKLFQLIGNDHANSFWMAHYDRDDMNEWMDNQHQHPHQHPHQQPITLQSDVDQKFVIDKYVRKKYLEKRETIFEKYKDSKLLNEELLECIRCGGGAGGGGGAGSYGDVLRLMKLFHIGNDIHYDHLLNCGEQYGQSIQMAFIKYQCKTQIKDWRSDLFDHHNGDGGGGSGADGTIFDKRSFPCSINNQPSFDEKSILIKYQSLQIFDKANDLKMICVVDFRNICLVREKQMDCDQINLIMIVRETEYSTKSSSSHNHNHNDSVINIIEFAANDRIQANDLRDFKNVLGQNMFPGFIPSSPYNCIAWVILSTISEDWKPLLLFLNYDSFVEFYHPKPNEQAAIRLDLRKIQKIEELKDKNYENVCPYQMYNLASICLISSIIYHIRGDTKESYEEILKAIQQSWCTRDANTLSDQFLTQNNVPLPIYKMIRYLQIHGTQIEGLFRRVGSVREADKIYNELITNPNSYVLTNCEPHDVASALKLFFRKLKDPLLTKRLYDNWIYAADLQNSEEKLIYYKQIIQAMPLVNYETLRLLIFLLVNIDKNNDITQMNPDNLGTSFNTCLLTGSQNEVFIPQSLLILPYLIRNYQDLFDVTQEELEIEKMYVKERKKINDFAPSETSILRQIYIDPELECLLKKDINFEKESANKKSKELLSKQLRIEQSMTTISLLKKIFNDQTDYKNIFIFEDRKIDDLHMHHMIYPHQNLVEVIQNSEQSDSKSALNKKFICKMNIQGSGIKHSSNSSSFKCWVSLSIKNKVYLELSETQQINIWKNDQTTELLINIPIRGMILFRSCEADKYIVAFEYRKNQSNSSQILNLLNLFSFKYRSSFNFISFYSKSDYQTFLQFYDQAKLIELTSRPITKTHF